MSTEVIFATNRTQPKREGGKFGKRFHSDGPHFYEVGRARVAWRDPDPEERDWEAYEVSYDVIPGEPPKVERPAPGTVPEMHVKRHEGKAGSAPLFRDLRRDMLRARHDILVYVHGFANDFEDSLARAAQLKERYRIARVENGEERGSYEPYMFAFCWPSDGKVQPPWKYADDREDAAFSGVAMARALCRLHAYLEQQRAQGRRCELRLHLVAHSMGNWALRHAVLGLRALMSEQRLPKIFENAFLMAADEDEDCFEHRDKLAALTDLAQSVHVYHSRGDLALKVSDATKGNMDRLGANGPRSFSGISARVAAIDCGKVDYTEVGHGNHQYYRLREEVIADVRQVLDGRLRPEEFPDRTVVEPGRRYRIKG